MNELSFRQLANEDSREAAHLPGRENGMNSVPLVVLLLRIVKRWKWLILGAVGICLLLGLTVTLMTTPLYTASATIEIQREDAQIVDVEGVQPNRGADLEFYETQYGLLQSRSLAERVVRDLRLQDDPAFFAAFGADEIAEGLEQRAPALQQASAREERIRLAGRILLGNVSVDPTQMSRLVDVQFTSADPTLSARIVNAWTENFISTSLEREFEATSYARRFLEERLEQLRQRLEESERLLVGYAAREGIVSIPSTTTSDAEGQSTTETPLVAENLSALNDALNEATAQRMRAQSRLRGPANSTAEALTNAAITNMRGRRAEIAADYAKLLTQFEPQYPPAQALANQLAEIDQSIAREEARVRNTLEQQYQSAASEESALRGRVNSLRSELLDLRGRTIQYNIYQREVDTNRQLYDGLLQRYKEIGVAGGVGRNNIAVVDPAQVPRGPSSPNLFLNLLVSLALGMLIGAGLAVALEQIDEAIADPSDVERALGFPLLGAIPKSQEDPDLELEDRKSAMSEAYLSMQTNLGFTTEHGVPRTIGVTSTRPGEGKTTTAFALSQSLARTGKRVLLIDADMRSPSIHNHFGLKNEAGLSNYLSGTDTMSALIKSGLENGLAVMTAGPQPPNAGELLTGERLPKMIAELSSTYDHLIFDFPPVMGLADAPLIASRVEGTVFVVESHITRASAARVAMGRLLAAQARILGVALTKFQSSRAHYGYGYEYGYGYGAKDAASAG